MAPLFFSDSSVNWFVQYNFWHVSVICKLSGQMVKFAILYYGALSLDIKKAILNDREEIENPKWKWIDIL